jgi:tRNA dimethylallyltransferase
MKKLLVICGATATGKTSLASALAKKFAGEIVSADSRQVYVGMDVGTGKDVQGGKWHISDLEWGMGITEGTEKKQKAQKIGYWEVRGVPIWMLDVVKPNQEFSVAQYVELAWTVIKDIWGRGKLPIMVGGTGFYIKAVVDGIETLGVPPDWELREKLKYYGTKILGEELKKLDPEKWEQMNESDRKNPRRLIRAIEIVQSRSTSEAEGDTSEVKEKKTLFVGLTAPYPSLYRLIDRRVEERVKQGAEKEIRQLLSKGYSWDNSVLGTTIGYREWQLMENGKTKEEIIQRWKYAEHAYARRQRTWFSKDKRIIWFDITKSDWREKVEKLVANWYIRVN